MTTRKARLIPIEDLRKVLSYDPETGDLIWRSDGQRVSHKTPKGYLSVYHNGQQYPAHRVAWALHHGAQPDRLMDHINGVRDDNRIVNLRLANGRQNCANTPSRSLSGYKGVDLRHNYPSKPWRAMMMVNYKRYTLGFFETAEEAGLVYEVVSEMVNGEFSFHLSRGEA